MARTEVRKECPSCGLGVPLEAKVCEFCGWDFEEEDEWISQIEKLEQELITEKQKFDDTAVDKMIRSSLHSTTGEKPVEGDHQMAAQVVVKKKVVAKGSVQVRISRPLGEDLLAEEKELEEEARPAPKPALATSRSRSVSIRVAVAKAPPPPDEFDLEEELAAREKEEMRGEEPAAETLEETTEAAPAEEPVAAVPAAATKTRRVRRVVSSPTGMPGASPTKGATTPTASSTKPAPTKAAPAKAAPAKKPAPPKAAPQKEEKKGMFGKLFGGGKEEKPKAKPAPSKAAPSKQAAPSKAATPSKSASSDKKPAQAAAPAKPQPKMFQCPLCNTMVKEEDKACPNCGAEFE